MGLFHVITVHSSVSTHLKKAFSTSGSRIGSFSHYSRGFYASQVMVRRISESLGLTHQTDPDLRPKNQGSHNGDSLISSESRHLYNSLFKKVYSKRNVHWIIVGTPVAVCHFMSKAFRIQNLSLFSDMFVKEIRNPKWSSCQTPIVYNEHPPKIIWWSVPFHWPKETQWCCKQAPSPCHPQASQERLLMDFGFWNFIFFWIWKFVFFDFGVCDFGVRHFRSLPTKH